MFVHIDQSLNRRSPWVHVGATSLSFFIVIAVNMMLSSLYSASNHPVTQAEGQTSFSASAVKGFFAVMSDAGTLHIYTVSQIFDYLFMFTLGLFSLTLASLLRRFNRPFKPGMKFASFGGSAVVFGLGFDGIENLISFVMLANPVDFPDFLAILYSTAAVIKFSFVAFGAIALLASIVTVLTICNERNPRTQVRDR